MKFKIHIKIERTKGEIKMKNSLNNLKQFFKTSNEIIEENKENYENDLLVKYGKSKKLKKYNLKILFITDTHNCLTYIFMDICMRKVKKY